MFRGQNRGGVDEDSLIASFSLTPVFICLLEEKVYLY
jgi:hypothetical protein